MKRDKYLKQWHKRWERVIYLRDVKKLTFEEIGKKMGVTRQRASQMYKQGTSE